MSNSDYILDETLLASSGIRFLNYILDLFFFILIMIIIGIIMRIIVDLFGLMALAELMQGNLLPNIIAIIVSTIYYTLTEGLFGRSPAKFITGTIVVDENGEKPNFDTIFKRSLCRFIPFEVFTFLGRSRGWHDTISDTYVVSKKKLQDDVKTFQEFNLIGVKEAN